KPRKRFLVFVCKNYGKKYADLGNQFYTERNWTEADKNYQKSLSWFKWLFWDKTDKNAIYFKEAVTKFNLSEYDLSLNYYQLALNNSQADKVLILNNMGNVWRSKNDYDKALDYYSQAITLETMDLKKYYDPAPFVNKIGTLILAGKYQQAIDDAGTMLSQYGQYLTKSELQKFLDLAQEKLKK
ncbi:MAG: tetratricopeptide repeat protein, partial [Patescibacteria group bacterium]|nr:tetratricopeptide repeat protein [Patescibacteria group bacterium]